MMVLISFSFVLTLLAVTAAFTLFALMIGSNETYQRIIANASVRAVEEELTFLQRDQFCRPVKEAVIRELARRTISAVKGLPV